MPNRVVVATDARLRVLDLSLVDVRSLAPSIVVDMPYATAENFTGRAIYPRNPQALLRRPVAEALANVQRDLRKDGMGLKVWDAYRPFSVQERLWAVFPDPRYVAKPEREGSVLVSGSAHNRGAAVDVTLVDSNGNELAMPTLFDDFSDRARRHSPVGTPEALLHRRILHAAMEKHGFKGIDAEWWHFEWRGHTRFPLSDEPLTCGPGLTIH